MLITLKAIDFFQFFSTGEEGRIMVDFDLTAVVLVFVT